MSETLDTWIESTQALLADEETVQEGNEHGGLAGRSFYRELPTMLKSAEALAENSSPTKVSPGQAAASKSSRSAPDSVGKSFDDASSKASDTLMSNALGKRK